MPLRHSKSGIGVGLRMSVLIPLIPIQPWEHWFEYSYRLTDIRERLPALLVGCQSLPAQFNGLGFVAERRLEAPFGGRTRDMIRVLKILYVCEGTPQLTLSS